jgi:serine/threonine-protein kinase
MTALSPRLVAALSEHYRLEKELGQGGMATVYLAQDLKHDRKVAIKVLTPQFAAMLGSERFLREIAVTAQLDHPHIVALLDSGMGTAEGKSFLYYVMPLVQGESLRDRLNREKQLPVDDALGIFREVADALSYSHERGFIHRDIKPENILLAHGHARVADFGIARAISVAGGSGLTETGLAIGTPCYMSPEQATADTQVDGRTDVYALGCVLYEMMAGEPPFQGPTPQAILARVLTESPRPLHVVRSGLPAGLEEVIHRATARVPADRFQSVGEFRDAVGNLSASGTLRAPSRRRSRKSILLTGVGVALLIAALAAGVMLRRNTASSTPTSIAVLPFGVDGGDTTDAYVGDGIADELLTSLGEIPNLRVAARSSAFALRAQRLDAREVGRRLGVGAVLDGTIRRQGKMIQVTVSLADARNGYQLYAERFQQPADDLPAVERQIAAAIAARLRVKMLGRSGTTDRRDHDPVAHDLLLQARYGRYSDSRSGLLHALPLIRQAIARDSSYPEAWAEMAEIYRLLAVFGDLPPDGLRLAREAADRAVALDSASSEAQAALGEILFRYDWDWSGAESHLRRALALNPSEEVAHRDYSRFLRSMQRFDEARRHLQSAEALSPLKPVGLARGRISYYERDYARAIRESMADSATDNRVYNGWMGLAYLGMKNYLKADSFFQRDSYVPFQAVLFARTNRKAEARRLLGDSTLAVTTDPYARARVFAALDEVDSAVAMLEEGERVRSPSMVDLQVDPLLDPIRGNVRFEALVKRMRFPEGMSAGARP